MDELVVSYEGVLNLLLNLVTKKDVGLDLKANDFLKGHAEWVSYFPGP